jgi:hypothetical protein
MDHYQSGGESHELRGKLDGGVDADFQRPTAHETDPDPQFTALNDFKVLPRIRNARACKPGYHQGHACGPIPP